jgi:hypothetical protein
VVITAKKEEVSTKMDKKTYSADNVFKSVVWALTVHAKFAQE